MKKFTRFIVSGLILISLVGIVIYRESKKGEAVGGNPFTSVHQWITHNSTVPLTANVVYVGTASTTYTFNTEGIDQINFNLFTVASDTVDILHTYYSFTNATTTGSDTWFRMDSSSTSGAVVTHNQRFDTWTPGATGTSTINIVISNINSKYMLIGFWAEATSTTNSMFGVWGDAILSRSY